MPGKANICKADDGSILLEGGIIFYRIREWQAVPGKFLGIVGQDPSDSKFNRLHVDIFRFCFIHLRYVL